MANSGLGLGGIIGTLVAIDLLARAVKGKSLPKARPFRITPLHKIKL